MFLISPCLVIFMLVYLFLKHAEQFYHRPSTASSRRWSNLSKWIFREFNEVDHLFRHRMNNSVVHGSDYVKQFPSPLISTIAKFIAFVSGGFAAILIIITILDESLLEGHVFGRNLLWYAAVFGTVIAVSRAVVSDELPVLDPEGAMSLVVQQTHYMPKRWRGKEHSDSVRKEFETLFQYTGTMLLEEMASIFIAPYLLIFVVPKRVNDLLRFVTEFTVDIEGVGHVCSFSTFDLEKHGNGKYGSPFDAARDMRSSQGKMEKSFLSFRNAYPTWEPSTHGRQLLSTLFKFREQKMRQDIHQEYYSSLPRPWQFNTSLRGQEGEMNHRFPSRDVIIDIGTIPDQRTHHPYLLDWYYVSRLLHQADTSDNSPLIPSTAPFETIQDLWPPHNKPIVIDEEENWDYGHLPERLQSHTEASSSSPLLKDGNLKHHDVEHNNVKWYNRPGPHSSEIQGSFREPPNWYDRPAPHSSAMEGSFLEPSAMFGHLNLSRNSDNVSDIRSSGEEEETDGRARDLRNLHTMSRTTYMNDSYEDEEVRLDFADDSRKDEGLSASGHVFGSPRIHLPVKKVPSSNDPVH